MDVNFKRSCLAKADGVSEDSKDYYDDEVIFKEDMNNVLLSLQTSSEFMNNPTRENLQVCLKKHFKMMVETFEQDWDFYAEEVVPNFIEWPDHNGLTTDESPREEWDALMKEMDSGNKIEVHESIYNYFLEVLPPKKMFDNGFLFAEGMEEYTKFTQENGKCYAQKLKGQWAPLE